MGRGVRDGAPVTEGVLGKRLAGAGGQHVDEDGAAVLAVKDNRRRHVLVDVPHLKVQHVCVPQTRPRAFNNKPSKTAV